MAGRWYYDLMGEVFGPVTWQQILESVSAGLLSDSDRVRPEAANTWQTIASVGSDAATPSTDSPEQLQVVDSLDDILMEDASMVAASVPSTAKMQSPHKPAPFRPDPVQPIQSQPIQAQPIQAQPIPAQPQYFVEMFGTVMGPMEFAELAAMITDHQVAATDQARSADSDIWRPVNQFPELQATLAAVPQMPVEPAPQPAPKLRPAAAAQPALEKQQLPQSLPVAESKPSDGADFTLSPTATLSEAEALAEAEKRRRMEERGNRPAARRRRKKSNAETPQYDPIMQEIYEEVFKDRDQQDSGAPGQARPAAAVASTPAASSPAAAATAPSTAVPASAAALTSSMPANTAVSLPSGHVAPTALPPAFSMPTAKPTLSGPRLSSGKSSSSFQLPDPKILGIGAGGTAIVGLIAALAMGWISLPGIGPGGATTDRAKAAIIACNMEIQALGQGPIRQVDWIEFTGTIQGRVAPLLSGSDAITDEQVTKAAKLLMDVAKCNPLKEAAKIKETAAQLGTIVNQM